MTTRRHFIRNAATGLFVPSLLGTIVSGRAVVPVGFWKRKASIAVEDYEDETQDYLDRIAGVGGTIEIEASDDVNDFVVGAKTDGFFGDLKRVNLYVGDFTALPVPLVKLWGNTLDTLQQFVSGDYSQATGLTGATSPTGANAKRLDTGIDPATEIPNINDNHVGCYVRTGSNGTQVVAGCGSSGDTSRYFNLYVSYNALSGADPWSILTEYTVSDSMGVGWYCFTRTASNASAVYKNGTSIVSSSAVLGGNLVNNAELSFHGANDSLLGVQAPTSRTLAGYTVGLGLNGTKQSNLNSRIQAFQTARGRNV